tara:strand:+ start:1048 stop:1557 length:510 start_codon:yes stop_codon:yes gene_type:complete
MLSLPDLVLNHILSFLNKDICHKNNNDLSILLTNKYISDFYKKHYKYKIHDYFDFSKYKNILKINHSTNSTIKNNNYIFCANKNCGLFNSKELNVLSNILYRYKKLYEEGILLNKYNNITDEKCNTMFIHFDNNRELENFRVKVYKSKINLWLDSNTCCNGLGCGVELL